jgi:hypothetical protein
MSLADVPLRELESSGSGFGGRPGVCQVFANGKMVEDEIGTSEDLTQQVGIEVPSGIAAQASTLHPHDGQRRFEPADNRQHTAALIGRP